MNNFLNDGIHFRKAELPQNKRDGLHGSFWYVNCDMHFSFDQNLYLTIQLDVAPQATSHQYAIVFNTSLFFLHRTIISMCFIDHVKKVLLAFVILTRWGRVTHICVSKLTIIVSDNGLSPGRRQAIIWTNDGILLTEPLGTKFSEILIGIQTFSFKKMRLKMSSAKWRPFCLGLNDLTLTHQEISKLRWLTWMPSASHPS